MRISIIGLGNVGTNLLNQFFLSGIEINEIIGRDREYLDKLSEQYNVAVCNDLKNVSTESDLYILSVSDDAINELALKIPKDKFVVHTSGSIDMSILNRFDQFGVFYPLQTFSKNKLLSFKDIPICIEADSEESCNRIIDLAEKITDSVYKINSEQRKYIHLAAVFACNFTNHMYAIAEDILKNSNVPKEIILPLIIETSQKFLNTPAKEAQTGPAKRNDQNIIKKQLDLLSSNPELSEIYKLITNNIQRYKDEEL